MLSDTSLNVMVKARDISDYAINWEDWKHAKSEVSTQISKSIIKVAWTGLF